MQLSRRSPYPISCQHASPRHNRGTRQLLLRLSSPGHQPRAKTTLLIHALHGPSVSSDAEDGLRCSKHPGRKTSPQPVPPRAGGSSSCRCSPRPQAACPRDLRTSPSPSWWCLSVSHTCTHTQPRPGQMQPPTQSPTGGNALFAKKALLCVSHLRSPPRHEDEARNLQRETKARQPHQAGDRSAQGVASTGRKRPGTSSLAGGSIAHLPWREHPFQRPPRLGSEPTFPSPDCREASVLLHVLGAPSVPTFPAQGPKKGDWGPKRKRGLSRTPTNLGPRLMGEKPGPSQKHISVNGNVPFPSLHFKRLSLRHFLQ